MLRFMREMTSSWIVKGLMLFLVISFSIWGIGDIFRGNSLKKAVASVGNTEISVQDLNQLFERGLVQARQALSDNLTAQQAKQLGLLDHVLDQEINSRLVDLDVARQKISVGPEAILDILAKEPQFRTKDGSFNKALFYQFLQQQRMSEAAFFAKEQQELARFILVGSLQSPAVAPQTAVDLIFKARAQKRTLDVVTVDASKMTGIAVPDDKALREFYDANQKKFETPEYRSLTIGTLSTDAIAKDFSVSDEQLKTLYEEKRDEFSIPERRDVVQVVTQDELKAKELARKARETGSLTSVAKALKENAVPLDKLEEKSLMPDLSKAAFALSAGGVSEPVKTQLGWHVVQLKKVFPAESPAFDKIKDKLREDMRREQAVEAATRIVNQLDDELAAGHSLDDIADGLRLRLVKIPAVDSDGLTPEGKVPQELPNKDVVLKDVFGQGVGETSPVAEDKNGGYYVVRTDDIVPSGVKPFDEVKKEVAAAWKIREQKAKARAKAEKIAQDLNSGAKLASLSGEEGVSVRTSAPLSMLGDTDKDLPETLVGKSFHLKKGETAQESVDGKSYVVRLAKISDIDASKPDTRKVAIARELKKQMRDEVSDQYLAYLQTVFPVRKNAELLEMIRQRED
ncbi:MAG: peptidyl-prolyl cis-trans isomerase [Alphaproteobacteria bacterium]|nr:peptidyl-prolyl cis-trans isomerase [Alphaproteobacteria bacterium]